MRSVHTTKSCELTSFQHEINEHGGRGRWARPARVLRVGPEAPGGMALSGCLGDVERRVGLERPSNLDAHAQRVRLAEWQGLEPQEPERALPPLDGDAGRAAAALLAAAAPPSPEQPEWAGKEGKQFLEKKLNDLIFSVIEKTKDGATRHNVCTLCNDDWKGTETRGKSHLLQKTNNGVSICHPSGSVKKNTLRDLQAAITPVVEALEAHAQDEVNMTRSDLKRKHEAAMQGGHKVKAALFAEELRGLPKTQGKLTHMVIPRPDHRNKPDEIKVIFPASSLPRPFSAALLTLALQLC